MRELDATANYIFLNRRKGMDLRTQKTYYALEVALLELMEEKPIDQIFITELAEKALVNRKTFYNHFSSIADVLDLVEQDFFNYALSLLPETITVKNTIEIYNLIHTILLAMDPYKDVLKKIYQNTQRNLVEEHFSGHIQPYINKCMANYHVDPNLVPYITQYVLHGAAGVFLLWFEQDDLSVDTLSLLSYNLVLSSIRLDNFRDISSEE